MSTDGVLGAAYLPSDGYIDPSQLTFALAEGARRRGAEVNTRTRVTGITVERGEVTGVETDKGMIETAIVINAGGMYAREIGDLAGVNVPIIPMAHEYLVLEPSGLPTDMPTMRDPSLLVYFRPESGGLIMGGYERNCAPWSLDGIPADFNGKLLEEDWPRFEELMENAIVRVPTLEGMGVVKLINGPEAFTPDGEFILGPSDVRGFWVAAGFCAHGLAGAGGMGQLVAEWVVDGTPSLDVWHMDSRRFGAAYRSRRVHACPHRGDLRDLLRRQVPRARAHGGPAAAGLVRLSAPRRARCRFRGEVRLGASELVRAERRTWRRISTAAMAGPASCGPPRSASSIAPAARRSRCSTSRPSQRSRSPGPVLRRFSSPMCANRVAREVGAVTYTQMLNERGGIECDFTVTRLAQERFRIVTGTAFGQHDLAWIRQHAPRDGSVHVADVTSALACFGVWGPSARSLLQPLTTTDLSADAFGYMRAQELSIGAVPCLAVRVTYVGELGWELYCPAEFGGRLWDTIWEAGEDHGLVAAGYKAIDSLRLEKGYRVWGADITPEESPLAAGLGFAVRLDKGPFLGRDALLAEPEPDSVLRCLTLDDPRAVALGSEPVRVGDRLVGRVTSGGFGYTVERSIAYAYLPAVDAAVERASRSRSSGTGSAERWRPSRSTIPRERGASVERRLGVAHGEVRLGLRGRIRRSQRSERIRDLEGLLRECEFLRRPASGAARITPATCRHDCPPPEQHPFEIRGGHLVAERRRVYIPELVQREGRGARAKPMFEYDSLPRRRSRAEWMIAP